MATGSIDHSFGVSLKANKGSILKLSKLPYAKIPIKVQCSARNYLGITEAEAILQVYPSRKAAPTGFPRFTNNFSVTVAKKNDQVLLHCQADASPPPRIIWFKEHRPIDTRDERLQIDGKFNLLLAPPDLTTLGGSVD
ncbi:hypothetical protein Ciccas_006010 [Cichlidogyrus casuarinus]|uniref:Ig-like domain-containing protein n=1 Tax=Cichlidogyrus casuarinus TaxID=1844966 RepID=A0ABD2Q858_9PLAT